MGPEQEMNELIGEVQVEESVLGNFYALIDNPNTRSLRLQGEIDGKTLQILIDGCSSHNFIQTRVANYLGLDITPTPQFAVIVGNGANLKCAGQCKHVKLNIQGNQFIKFLCY